MAKRASKKIETNNPQMFDQNSEAKQKALEAALGELTKRYGEGTIMSLGEAAHLTVDTIPTGSLGLDIALGVGGIPRGRITEIYGPESSGKCVTENTYLLTQAGLLTIGELFVHAGFNTACTSKIKEAAWGLVNEVGELETTSHFTWNNRKPIKRIRTHLGLTLEATHNHRIRIMNERGSIVWRNAGDVQIGDKLPIIRGAEQFGAGLLTTDEAELLGYLVADGSLNDVDRTAFSNSDPEVIENFNRIVEGMTATPVRVYAKANRTTIDHHINDKAFRAWLHEAYGLAYVKAAEKSVPLCVRQAGREAQIAFLRGYFELECGIEAAKSVIEVTSASRQLLEQVQLMLLNLGFVARLSEKVVNDVTYYRLTLSALDYEKYAEIIGFRTTARQAQYDARPDRKQIQTNIDSIPYMGNILRDLYDGADTDREGSKLIFDYMGDTPKAALTYDRLKQIITYFDAIDRNLGPAQAHLLDYLRHLAYQHYYFDSVVSIEDDTLPTFDVVMPETHSFWSNGFASHNTTVCLHIIREAQKRGGICAFVDMEHALDPVYSERIGVNLDTLFVSQPDTAEQALEITEHLVRSGAIDVIVIDSVAALVPRAEIEGEMGDSHVGLQARLMSQALRKLAGAIKQSNACVIFTNQLREKVGVMFGCLSGDTRVTLADGTEETIQRIVDEKLDVEVLSYNVETQQFEPRSIINWFDNGTADEFLRIAFEGDFAPEYFDCTPNHMILTEHGYVPASELEVGDKIIAAMPMLELVGFAPEVAYGYEYIAAAVPIISIESAPVRDDMRRFDIEVDGNHCYLANGYVVHNSPETTTGGRALKFYASVRLDIRRIQGIKSGEDEIGSRTRIKVKKNKVAAPFKECEFDIMFYEGGISKVGEIIDLGVELGVIEKRGAFFRYNESLLGQGRENSKEFLRENPAISDAIESAIRQHFALPDKGGLPKSPAAPKGDSDMLPGMMDDE
jgi:recombination protein RecA